MLSELDRSIARRCSLLVSAAALTLAVAGSAHAQLPLHPAGGQHLPTLASATTGLLLTPNAYLQGNTEVTGYVAVQRDVAGGALVGILNRAEVGVNYGSTEANSSRKTFSGKLRLIPETLVTPAVSVGIGDAFGGHGSRDSAYAVVSKDVIPYFVTAVTGKRLISVRVSAGYGSGLYRDRAFIGAEVWGPGGIGAVVEESAGQPNVGIRFSHSGFGATLGWLDAKRAAGSVSYSLAVL